MDNYHEQMRLSVHGVVQGIGFRPFVYRLAHEKHLCGWVHNSLSGVEILVEGERSLLEDFAKKIRNQAPKEAKIFSLELSFHKPVGYKDFVIQKSHLVGEGTVSVLADLATCAECLQEIQCVEERRFTYPFTNCTHCGPRFTIMHRVPYDRSNTSMDHFNFCKACLTEYNNPLDRRFHAQPIACPECGPWLEYWDVNKNVLTRDNVFFVAVHDLKAGNIVAVKGLGGFHIMIDAQNDRAINRLREKKPRRDKPFALMFPTLAEIKKHCHLNPAEELLLTGPQSPIVLLKRKTDSTLPECIAPENPYLGCMLPYTPLHKLLMDKMGSPVIATSGNLSDEPICTENEEAVSRLGAFVDRFLVHNRPIVRHVDDSIIRITSKDVVLLRRARGYAPLPLLSKNKLPRILALGSDLKNAIGISKGHEIFLSQHIGDLESKEAYDAFVQVIEDFETLFDFKPELVACDLHPGFFSSQHAREFDLPIKKVQHHHAHMAACMLENDLDEDVLGIIWDGTGYGLDGTIWGGEFFVGSYSGFKRVGHLRTFPLVGGDTAIKEPRRVALGILHEVFGASSLPSDCPAIQTFSSQDIDLLCRAIDRNVNSLRTSSMGRLFDGVSSITGLKQRISFEGQAAMTLEFAAKEELDKPYTYKINERDGVFVLDWSPMIREILKEKCVKTVASRFHATLVDMIVDVATRVGLGKIVLSGGVFQNTTLLQATQNRLRREGFDVFSHQRIPPNDGGLAAGQILVAAYNMCMKNKPIHST